MTRILRFWRSYGCMVVGHKLKAHRFANGFTYKQCERCGCWR